MTDDEDYARKFAEKTWGASKDKEKTAFEKIEEEEKKKQEVRACAFRQDGPRSYTLCGPVWNSRAGNGLGIILEPEPLSKITLGLLYTRLAK